MAAAPPVFVAIDLLIWAVAFVVLVLAYTTKFWLTPIFSAINHTIGHIPWVGGKIRGGEEAVINALNAVIHSTRWALTAVFQGTRWATLQLIDGTRDFADDVHEKWNQLLGQAIPGALDRLYAKLHGEVSSVSNRVTNLAGAIGSLLDDAKGYADRAANGAQAAASRYADRAVSDLQSWTTSHVNGVYKEVEADISGAAGALTRYVDSSVGALRQAEDAAVGAARAAAAGALEQARRELGDAIGATSSALAAFEAAIEGELGDVRSGAGQALSVAAGELRRAIGAGVAEAEQVARDALATAAAGLEAELGAAASAAAAELHETAAGLETALGAVRAAEQATVAELSAAEQAAAGELADIYGLPADQLRALLDRLDLTKLLGFGAGLVLVRALVQAIAAEAGLDDAACRAKHKQICNVEGGEWGDLLGGALFLTGALSLAELAPIGRQAIAELAAVMRLAA